MTGYNASAEFIMDTLSTLPCTMTQEHFLTAVNIELAPPQLSLITPYYTQFLLGTDFGGLRYGGNSTVQNLTRPICIIKNDGCSANDFNETQIDCIALITFTSNCTLLEQSMNAERANCSAVIFYVTNPRTIVLPNARVNTPTGWVPGSDLVTIPVLVCSYSVGNLLRQLTNPIVSLNSSTSIVITTTFNIYCDTEGDPNNMMVVGSHLDSVIQGPGINDNGSGSSTLLEIIIQWFKLEMKHKNKIRFAWWGSEELGLIGSRYYVRNLTPGALNQTVMNINFDMLGSPNYIIAVHDGRTAVKAKNESYVITGMFTEYFDYMGIPWEYSPLVSGSDFVPFIEAGIPSGGVSTGASGIKTQEQRTKFGGFANTQLDPCYHIACDTIDNINEASLEQMASAGAYVIQKTAQMSNLREFLSSGSGAS